jgi:hypothetical protein
MRSSCREEVVEVFDALEANLKRALDLCFDALSTPERFALLQRSERVRRQLPASPPVAPRGPFLRRRKAGLRLGDLAALES